MRPITLVLVAALPLCAMSRSGPDSLAFKRIFKADAKDTYTYTTGPHGEPPMIICEYAATVTEVTSSGASIKFEIIKTDLPGLGASQPVPPLTSKVGPENMPASASIKDGTEFLLFGSVAGITPNKDAKVGDKVFAHWQNDPKDVTFDANGKLVSIDASSKTLTVTWDIKMTPSYTTGGEFKLKSTYSLADFSVVKSEGTCTVGNTVMDVKLVHEAPKPS